MEKQWLSVVAGKGAIEWYEDLGANVRYDGSYHSIKGLVQPEETEVREVARVLHEAADFVEAAQEFVNSFTTYEREAGDYWAKPGETLAKRAGDCDCLSILLCSILRNYIPADQVYCAFGLWKIRGKSGGHMWVIVEGQDGQDRIIEATAGTDKPTRGNYIIHGFFNDRFAFATDVGLREYNLRPLKPAEPILRR